MLAPSPRVRKPRPVARDGPGAARATGPGNCPDLRAPCQAALSVSPRLRSVTLPRVARARSAFARARGAQRVRVACSACALASPITSRLCAALRVACEPMASGPAVRLLLATSLARRARRDPGAVPTCARRARRRSFSNELGVGIGLGVGWAREISPLFFDETLIFVSLILLSASIKCVVESDSPTLARRPGGPTASRALRGRGSSPSRSASRTVGRGSARGGRSAWCGPTCRIVSGLGIPGITRRT